MNEISWRFAPRLVEERLAQLLPDASVPDASVPDAEQSAPHAWPPELARLRQAMREAVFGGGKRMRSQLATEAFAVVCQARRAELDAEAILPAACALEMIHAYSLVHDDLPAMDNADTRRGRPSCHVAWGEATAILVGDGLQTLAFETLCGLRAEPSRALQAVCLLAKASGEAGMVGGQAIDIDWSQEHVTQVTGDQLLGMHALKTGALIRAASEMGAVLAGGDEAQVGALRSYGAHLGRAFQIQDDVLDVEGDPEVTGKKATDEANFKITATGAFGLERAKGLAVESAQAAVDALGIFGSEADTLRALAQFVTARRR
jgi:geranylgeranyl diphosphate synthase type II